MTDGTGFAHFEFPTEQGPGYASNPHYQTFDLEAGGLVELAGAEIPSGRSYGSNPFFEALNQTQDVWKGFPVADEYRNRRQDEEYVRNWKLDEAKVRAEAASDSSIPWEFQSLTSGPAAGVESMGAAVMRMIDPETSNWMVRATQARGLGHELGMSKEELSETRKWFNTNLYGAARSLTQAALAAALAKVTGGGSFAMMTGTFMGTAANDSYVEAIDYGLSPKKASTYAWKQGAFEGGVMIVFQMVGLGGLEKALIGKSIWKSLGKEFGKDFLAELTEEEITTVLQEMSRVASMPEGKFRNAWIGDDGTFESSSMRQALIDTASQTLFMMGGPRAAGSAGRSAGKAWTFLIEPSRNSIVVMPDAVRGPLEEKHGDFKNRDNRQAASDDLLFQYVGILDGKKETESEIEYWNTVAEDEGRTEKAREAAAGVASRLGGGDFGAKDVGRELLEVISERMSKREESSRGTSQTIPAPEAARDRKVEVPQAILQQDPDATIVDPLDLVPKDASEDALVRVMSLIRELSRETRGGRDVRFVQTEDPNVKGAYSGDGIYVTIPKVKRYMKDGELDEEGLRKALTGTFAHEYTHELWRKHPEAWKKLFASLQGDGKYGKILEQGRRDFLGQVEKAESLDVDPYAKYRGDENAEALKELADEESLSYLMDDQFISTGLVSKIAKTDSNAFEMMRDWLRRIRNSLFRDKLYKGMVGVFNDVASDMGIQPIAVRPVTESVPDKPKKERRKTAKRSRKHTLKKGLPEWAEGPVADLEKRGSKVIRKNHASENAVVVTVKTKAGNTQVVMLSLARINAAGDRTFVNKTIQKATDANYDAKVEDAISDAMAVDAYAEEVGPPPDEVAPTDQLNEDLDEVYFSLREGRSNEEGDVESTDIEAFTGLLEDTGKADENGPYLEDGDVSDVDVSSMRDRGLVLSDEDGRLRLTSLGMRAMSWEGPDVVGKFEEEVLADEPDYRLSMGAVEGLGDQDVELMELAILTADIALTTSPYTGRAFDLIEEIWDGDVEGEISGWLRKNKLESLKDVVNTVWNEHHEGVLKEYGGELSRFVPLVRKRMIKGKHVSIDKAEANLLRRAKAVVPHPNEYRQLGESSDRMSIKIHDLDLPEEYYDETSKHHVDERTRAAVDKVRAYDHIKTPVEIRTHLQDEVWGQSTFNKDPLGTIKAMIDKGLRGDVFTSRDWVMAELGHSHILSIMDAGGLTAKEMDDLTQQKIWLAQYSNEAASEWGRAGSMMRDRVESVRMRGRRALDKAMFSKTNNIRRKLAYWQGMLGKGRPEAAERVADVRREWMAENKAVMDRLRAKGWDIDQLDKYMGSREAVEAFVHEVMKEKGEVGTASGIAYEIFINFILSGPLTHAANVISNVSFSAYEFGPKRFAHALLNEAALLSGLGDKMAPRIGELPHLYRAMATGFAEGAKHFWRSVVTEEESFEKSLGISAGRRKLGHDHRHHIKGPAGRVLRIFGTTMLTALDSWQKSVNAHGEVVALAYREAKFNGLVDDKVGEFMDGVMRDKSHRLWTDALVSARDKVFQGDPSALAKAALGARRTVPGVRWLLPFILTPDNLLRKGVSYSPLGALSLPKGAYDGFTKGDWSGMGEKSVQQLIAWAFVMVLLGDDDERPLITGTTPDQPKEWAAGQRSRTIPPMSVRVGDGYVSYARIEPLSTFLAVSKDITVAIRKGDFSFGWDKMTESVIELTKDKTFLRVVSDIGYLLNNPKNGGRRIAGGFITAASPNIYKQIVRSGRENKRERRDWGDDDRLKMWGKNLLRKMEIPVFEEYDKFDQYGEKIPENYNPFSSTKASFWYKLLVPAKGKSVHEGVADKVLRRWNEQNPDKRKGIDEPDPYFIVKGERVYLSKQEYMEYGQLNGSIFKGLVDSEAVDLETPEEGYIETLWNKNQSASRRAAENILTKKWSGLPYEDDAKEVSQKIHENNINKRITVLAKPNPSIYKQDKYTRSLPIEKRREVLDAKMGELIEEKKEAAEFLVQQGYTKKNFTKLTARKITTGWARAIRSFKNFSGGVTGERKRSVPPRVGGSRQAS